MPTSRNASQLADATSNTAKKTEDEKVAVHVAIWKVCVCLGFCVRRILKFWCQIGYITRPHIVECRVKLPLVLADNRALREALGLTHINLEVWCAGLTRWYSCDIFDRLPTGKSRFILLRAPDAPRCGGFGGLVAQAEAGKFEDDDPVIVLH